MYVYVTEYVPSIGVALHKGWNYTKFQI
jgi:hypothetical protein